MDMMSSKSNFLPQEFVNSLHDSIFISAIKNIKCVHNKLIIFSGYFMK